ncbi:MAG: ketoacyl-ACP synthase III [Mangrovibacterium sp.]
MKAFIKAISYYLPEKILTNTELVKEFPEWTVEKVADKIGVTERHISAIDETSTDMAVKVGKKFFREYNIIPEEIDFVMLCTQSPDFFLPTSACIIQDKLNIPVSSGALDFNLGCSGFVYGLALAKGLIVAGIAKNVLLLTSETYSKFIHPKDKGNRTIFGDGAAATLISTEGFAEIMEFSLGTNGKGAPNLMIKTGGMKQPETLNDLKFDELGNLTSSDHLYMNGSEIFNFSLEMVPALVKETLENNKFNMEEIDQFVFHQANKYMLNFIRKKIRIPEAKFYYYMEKVGNTVSATIPIALYEAIKDKTIQAGQKVMIAGFGVGYSWAGNVLKL